MSDEHLAHRPRPAFQPLGPVRIPPLPVLRAQRDAWRLSAPGRGYREEVLDGYARVTFIENGDVLKEVEADTEHAALANALQAVRPL